MYVDGSPNVCICFSWVRERVLMTFPATLVIHVFQSSSPFIDCDKQCCEIYVNTIICSYCAFNFNMTMKSPLKLDSLDLHNLIQTIIWVQVYNLHVVVLGKYYQLIISETCFIQLDLICISLVCCTVANIRTTMFKTQRTYSVHIVIHV